VHGKSLVHDLKSSRYQQKSCWFFSTPHVHSFLYQIYQQEKYLAEVLASIAEMDAYHAIATKMAALQQGENKLCFVSFLNGEKPHITMKGFWNVLVKNAVSNDINEDHHVILTGPNAGGKTTTIRAILQNILLGQSFGIAAAEACEFTIFDVIHSYLNISDDLLNGLSLFASEIKRAQEIVEKIKTLTPSQKFFFALDELFTGTNATDGEKCAYNFINRIADTEKAQFIYATHFDKLKELGNIHNHCANYQLDAPTKNAQSKLIYPFTLSKGSSNSHVALDLAQAAHLFA
jgi:DNA mismatch repair protein MutS